MRAEPWLDETRHGLNHTFHSGVIIAPQLAGGNPECIPRPSGPFLDPNRSSDDTKHIVLGPCRPLPKGRRQSGWLHPSRRGARQRCLALERHDSRLRAALLLQRLKVFYPAGVLSVAVVTRLAKGPAAEFAVFKKSAKSGIVIFSENIRIIYHAPNDIQFASCTKLLEFRFLESLVDRI
jgi:hypothetical protein